MLGLRFAPAFALVVWPLCLAAQTTPSVKPGRTNPSAGAILSSVPVPRGALRGIVLSEARQPLPAAAVSVRSAADSVLVAGALTDEGGRFVVRGVRNGRYVVRVSRLGYSVHVSAVIDVADSPVDLGSIMLEPAPVNLTGIEATAERAPVVIAADRTIYNTKGMPVAAGGSMADLLRSIPELEVDMDGRVTLRGSQSVAIHLNGRPAPIRGQGLQQFIQQFPASRVERIEVMANPSAKYDPEGLGGIINIVLKDNSGLGLSGSLSANVGTSGARGTYTQLAYQEGRVALFGDAVLSHMLYDGTTHDLRENLLAQPLTYLDLAGQSRYAMVFGMLDGSLEYKLTRTVTAWVSLNGWSNGSDLAGTTGYTWLDAGHAPTDRYTRASGTSNGGLAGDVNVGLRRQLRPMKNEWSIELRRTTDARDVDAAITEMPLAPAIDSTLFTPTLLANTTSSHGQQWIAQADLTRPWRAQGRIETGYRGSFRRDNGDLLLTTTPFGAALVRTASGYQYREQVQAAYVTLSTQHGRMGLQAGMRAEATTTEFAGQTEAGSVRDSYASLFPSGNVSFDFGGGRQLRLSYTKRVERPLAAQLNPDVPTTDSLNRTRGNPHLRPRFTNSISADLTWVRPEVVLQFSPYLRRTVSNWDNIKTVDALGVSTMTWENTGVQDTYGASAMASLRPTGRLGGFASLNVYHSSYDARTLSSSYIRQGTYASLNLNATVKLTPTLDTQWMLMYMPPRDVPQGKMSSLTLLNIGIRQRIGTRARLNLALSDPFQLYRYTVSLSDATFLQTSSSNFHNRMVALNLSYTFGRPPQSVRRQQGQERQERQPTEREIR